MAPPAELSRPLQHLAADALVGAHHAVTVGSRDVYHATTLVHVSETAQLAEDASQSLTASVGDPHLLEIAHPGVVLDG